MLTLTPRRMWTLIGAAGVLVIVAIGWFFFIHPENGSRVDLLNQASDARASADVSRAKMAALAADNKKLPVYRQQLGALAEALPKGADTATFVTNMQLLGQQSHITITAINVTPPSATSGGAPQLVAGTTPLPITVSATGATADLQRFLTLLQTRSARAVLVGQVSQAAPLSGSGDLAPTLTISMRAFFTS